MKAERLSRSRDPDGAWDIVIYHIDFADWASKKVSLHAGQEFGYHTRIDVDDLWSYAVEGMYRAALWYSRGAIAPVLRTAAHRGAYEGLRTLSRLDGWARGAKVQRAQIFGYSNEVIERRFDREDEEVAEEFEHLLNLDAIRYLEPPSQARQVIERYILADRRL